MDNFLARTNRTAKIKISPLTKTELELSPSEQEEYNRQIKELKHFRFHESVKCSQELITRVIKKPIGKSLALLNRRYCPTHDVLVDMTGWEIGWFGGQYSKDLNKK